MSSGNNVSHNKTEVKNDIAKVAVLKEFSADSSYLKGTKNSMNRAKINQETSQATEAFVEGALPAGSV